MNIVTDLVDKRVEFTDYAHGANANSPRDTRHVCGQIVAVTATPSKYVELSGIQNSPDIWVTVAIKTKEQNRFMFKTVLIEEVSLVTGNVADNRNIDLGLADPLN